eukprot:TRINITY_DN61881_c0_g1_i1.p1 TRINITY_DN61881_c0_g1~~TRINITY_DN61881_c0_g1_i1.p1  ORF type:complete len:609 (+),score=35.04 TRINITY_DN61881_c0_g1_i1:47-1828(+)
MATQILLAELLDTNRRNTLQSLGHMRSYNQNGGIWTLQPWKDQKNGKRNSQIVTDLPGALDWFQDLGRLMHEAVTTVLRELGTSEAVSFKFRTNQDKQGFKPSGTYDEYSQCFLFNDLYDNLSQLEALQKHLWRKGFVVQQPFVVYDPKITLPVPDGVDDRTNYVWATVQYALWYGEPIDVCSVLTVLIGIVNLLRHKESCRNAAARDPRLLVELFVELFQAVMATFEHYFIQLNLDVNLLRTCTQAIHFRQNEARMISIELKGTMKTKMLNGLNQHNWPWVASTLKSLPIAHLDNFLLTFVPRVLSVDFDVHVPVDLEEPALRIPFEIGAQGAYRGFLDHATKLAQNLCSQHPDFNDWMSELKGADIFQLMNERLADSEQISVVPPQEILAVAGNGVLWQAFADTITEQAYYYNSSPNQWNYRQQTVNDALYNILNGFPLLWRQIRQLLREVRASIDHQRSGIWERAEVVYLAAWLWGSVFNHFKHRVDDDVYNEMLQALTAHVDDVRKFMEQQHRRQRLHSQLWGWDEATKRAVMDELVEHIDVDLVDEKNKKQASYLSIYIAEWLEFKGVHVFVGSSTEDIDFEDCQNFV